MQIDETPDFVISLLIQYWVWSSMNLRVVCRKIYDYVRYDLKEIAFPSSLPDPPHIKKCHKLTWKERYLVLKEASRLYAASWVRDIGSDLRPNEYKKKVEGEDNPTGERETTKEKEPSTLDDLAVAARGGMETLRPALQRVYMTRASGYRDALKVLSKAIKRVYSKLWRRAKNPNPSKDLKLPNNKLDSHEEQFGEFFSIFQFVSSD